MPAEKPRSRKSRARRVLGVIGAVVGATVTFVTATAAAAVVHLDVPATRRLVTTQVNGILRSQFAGDVQIERLGGLGLRGVSGVRVRVKDPEGVQVLYVDGAHVRIRALDAARSFLFEDGDIRVPVDTVSIDHVDAAIDGDPAGNLRIANAFAERTPTPPKPKDPNARGVRVEAPSIALKHAWVHGQAPGAPPMDAELNELAAHVHYDPKLTRADLDRVDLVTRGLPRGADPRGRVNAHFAQPSATGKDMGVDAAFDGVIAGIPTSAQAKMDGQKIDAVLDGHDRTGQGVRATFGEVGIQEEVTLHADAHGELPKIAAKARVALGKGTVDLDGNVDLTDGTKADAVIAVRHIDAHAIVPSAPVSDVGLDARVNVAIARSGAINGDIALDTLPGKVAGEALPILKVRGEFTKETAHAIGRIVDPRAVADFEANMTTVSGSPIVEGQLRTSIPNLSRLPQVGPSMKGHASLTAQGRANLGTKTFDARAHVLGGKIAYGVQTVDDVRVLATAKGSMDRPVVDVGIHAGGLASGEQKVGTADVRARVEPGAVTTIRDAHVDVVREGFTISAGAARVKIGGPRLEVEGGIITGLGEPIHADVSRDAREMKIELEAPSIDLQRVAIIAGKPNAIRSGTLGMKGHLSIRRDGATGELHAKVENLSAARIHNGKVAMDVSFDGKALGLGIKAEMAEAGTFELATGDVVIGGSPLDPESWKRAHGRAKFDANLDMAKLAELVPKEQLPVSELRGQLVVAGSVRRDSVDVPPEMSVHAHTRGLILAGKVPYERPHDEEHGKTVSGVQPWRSEGVDASVEARVDATSGYGEASLHVVDKKGTLLGFNVKSDLPYRQIVSDPSKAMALMKNAPISAKLVVPKRGFSDLPEIAGTRSLPGTVEAELDVTGTALEPKVVFVGHVRGVRSPVLPVNMASDADVNLTYDGEKADFLAKVRNDKREVLEIGSHVDVRTRDLLEPTGQPLAWEGSARVKLASFKLDTVNALADRQIKGSISGEAVLEDLHKDAKMHAQIGLEGLKIGNAVYKSGSVVLDARDGKLLANARLEQTDGYADIKASAGMAWGADLVPTVDTQAPVEAHLGAKAFRAAAILPFTGGALNELDGRIDADATVKLGGAGGAAPSMEGRVVFREGSVQLAAIGEQFRQARATVTFQPGGVIKVDDVYMHGTSGELTANALVRTRGLDLVSATGNVHIPNKRPLDLAMDGQPIGEVAGDIKLMAVNSEDGKHMKVTVDVPTLTIELPQKMKSGLQELNEKDAIRVGVFRDPKSFVKLPLDKEDLEPPPSEKPAVATIMDVDVRLGEITVVQGNMARIVLGGAPHIHMDGGAPEVTGQIAVKQGKIDVQGKKFEIERGTITFQKEDAANPIIVATAVYESDDGSKIFADFVGPVATGKVTLRSEPPRPRNEILALILFGTADGANATPPPPGRAPDGTTKAAVGVGGGFAAQGLTEAMDDLTGVQATARIDTSRANNPAPEIEIQLARRISVAFQHVLGTPPLSSPDKNLATFDWRFRRNWSLETQFGDRGKLQTDAVWQKRY